MRLGPELGSQVEAFRAENAIDGTSAAVRALIGLGLERSGQLDLAWRKLAWREAIVKGSAVLKAAYQEAIARALHEGGVE